MYSIYMCIIFILIWIVVLGVVVIIVGYGQVTFWLMAAYRQTQKMRTALLAAILKQEIGWFDTTETAELGTRLAAYVKVITYYLFAFERLIEVFDRNICI